MEKIILVVHVLTALAIIGLILMQQGKGAEAGASFGAGASQTVFGSQGSGNFFTRTTAILATIFFVTSFSLAVVAKQQASVGLTDGMPVVDDAASIPAAVDARSAPIDGDVPASNMRPSDVPPASGDVAEGDIPAFDLPDSESSELPQ